MTINLGLTGPHYTIGAACAAGNAGLIQAAQMLRLGEVDIALAGGVSESIHTFGIFAAFKAQGALAHHADPNKASRPFDRDRNGIVISEGGALYVVERLSDALARGARIICEIAGYQINSDATDAVLPNPDRQAECMAAAIARSGLEAARHRPCLHPRHRHAPGRRAGMRRTAPRLRGLPGHLFQQHQELHRPRDGRGRRARAGRQPAHVCGRINPPNN